MFLPRVSTLGRILTPSLHRGATCRSVLNIRHLSATPLRHASDSPQPQFDPEALEALRSSDLFQKVSQNPDALQAIQKLSGIMLKLGVQPTPGKTPSFVQMSKLLLNSEFREASQNVIEEFKKAGIDPSDKETMEKMTSLMGKFRK